MSEKETKLIYMVGTTTPVYKCFRVPVGFNPQLTNWGYREVLEAIEDTLQDISGDNMYYHEATIEEVRDCFSYDETATDLSDYQLN